VRVSERIQMCRNTVLSATNAKRVERSSTRFVAIANGRVTVLSGYLPEPLPRKCGLTLSVLSEKLRKKAALQGNGHGMRAIIGAEL
jgi:hypothetical protein